MHKEIGVDWIDKLNSFQKLFIIQALIMRSFVSREFVWFQFPSIFKWIFIEFFDVSSSRTDYFRLNDINTKKPLIVYWVL